MRLPLAYLLFAFVLPPCLSLAGETVRTIPLVIESGEGAGEAMSSGGSLREEGFDPGGERADLKESTGVVFQSFRPGTVWFGEPPGFIAPEIEVGGEEVLPLTDVYEDGQFLYAHYGPEHYKTRAVSVIDANRREVLRLTAFSLEDVSRLHFDPETEVVYFSTLEGNLDGAGSARIHAFSVADETLLWSSAEGSAHGDFLVLDKHLVTKYGFTGIDDFVFLLDKGDGKTVAKHQLKTAASGLIREGDGGEIIVPCYKGVVTLQVTED